MTGMRDSSSRVVANLINWQPFGSFGSKRTLRKCGWLYSVHGSCLLLLVCNKERYIFGGAVPLIPRRTGARPAFVASLRLCEKLKCISHHKQRRTIFLLMAEMSYASKHHGDAMFIRFFDNCRVAPSSHLVARSLSLQQLLLRQRHRGREEASLASTAPLAFSSAWLAAMLLELTRLIWPAPAPTRTPSLTMQMALDLRCLQISHDSLRSVSSASLGARSLTTSNLSASQPILS